MSNVFIISIMTIVVVEISAEIIVQTSLGSIRGSVATSVSGKSYFSFRGVHYATSKRFEPSIPIKPWPGDLDATTDGLICPQPTVMTYNTNPSEDCLTLNVYSRNLSANSRVLVFIHGGANFAGTSASWFYGADYIMDHDHMVFVSINYRLGPFGFIGTGTSECPGNMGYKDQVIALRWVKEHIRDFGGDPDFVTLMGQSAGATSVNLLLVSPMARQLFHGAILMSGSAMEKIPYRKNQLDNFYRLVNHFGCNKNDTSTMLSCLRDVPADQLANTLEVMHEFHIFPMQSWYAVIEDDFGQERFLVEDPIVSLRDGRFNRVPILTGVTSYEFTSLAVRVLAKTTLRNELKVNFGKHAPFIFSYENGTDRSVNLTQTIRDRFKLMDIEYNRDIVERMGNVISDGNVNFGVDRFVRLAAPWTQVYYYKNSYVSKYSHFPYLADVGSIDRDYSALNQTYFGNAHGDDLMYLLYMPKLSRKLNQDDREMKMVHRLIKMWMNFIRSG